MEEDAKGVEGSNPSQEAMKTRVSLRRVFGRKKFRMMVAIAIFYAALSLVYSAIGFLHYQPGSHYHEYVLARFVLEITGHFAFGFAAALPLLDLDISLLTGALAVLIDLDHLLGALNLNISGRPDHSILFLFVSSAFIVYFANRLGLSSDLTAKLLVVGPVTLLAHLSYDIFFAASGTTFQLFIPISFQEYYFPMSSWIYFEAGAIALSFLGLWLSRRVSRRAKLVVPRVQSARGRSFKAGAP